LFGFKLLHGGSYEVCIILGRLDLYPDIIRLITSRGESDGVREMRV